VIDDWQRVSDAGTTAALGFLLEHGCHHLQIIVTSWSRSGLPVSKLRIKDEIVEIDGGSLRFDEAEAQSFLNDIGGLKLSGADVNALTTSTDGWAAALQLATLSLRAGADADRLMSGLCGANDVICEFLAENVLDTLEPELAEFMLATSVSGRTCGELACVLAQTARGQGDPRGSRAPRIVPPTGRGRSGVVSVPPVVRGVSTSSTRTRPPRRDRAASTAARLRGLPNMDTSTRPSTTPWPRTIPKPQFSWSKRMRRRCSSSPR